MEKLNNNNLKTSGLQVFLRILLGAFLLSAGIGHLTWARAEFRAQVPTWLPMNEDMVVVLSGIVEIIMGGALLFLFKNRVTVGWIVAVFFVLVFPGNISQYVHHVDAFGLNSDGKRAVRLLFQPVLVVWALWSTGAWHAWRSSHSA